MENVRIYDFEFNLLHIEHNISSCNWSLYENEIGTFEMHYALKSPLTKIAGENRYLVAVQGEKQAIITGKQFGEEGVLYGRTCNWILTRFCVCEKFDTKQLKETGELQENDAQTVCMYLLQKAMGDIPNFVFKVNSETDFAEIFLENKKVSSAYELVKECMKQAGGGHKVWFDVKEKQWCFQLTKGKMLSTVLSENNRNAYEMEYAADLQNLFSGGYFEKNITDMGDWDIFRNEPYLVNEDRDNYAKGYKVCLDKEVSGVSFIRRFDITFYDGDYIICTTKDGVWRKTESLENFVEEIKSPLSGIYAWQTELEGKDEDEATRDLARFAEESKMRLKAKGFLYGRDYFPGDYVVQEFAKGTFFTRLTKKITGVHLWYEQNDVGEQPIFEEALQ